VKAPIAISIAFVILSMAAPASAAPPPNDNFADAQPISAPANVAGTTVEATREAGEFNYDQYDGFGKGTVWYSFTAPKTVRYRIADCGVANPSLIFVFTGSSFTDLKRVSPKYEGPDDSNFDCGPNDDKGDWFFFYANAGTTYRIAVLDHFEELAGQPFTLTLDERPNPVFDTGITQKASKSAVKKGGTVTYTVTLRNTGTVTIDQEWINLTASKPNKLASKALQVKYLSLKTTRGKCHRQTFFSQHKGAQCAVGRLAPGEFAVVTAKVKVSQAITHWAFLDYNPGRGDAVFDDNGKNDSAKVLTKLKKH
jgi:uncharacterized protein DUF11